MPASGLLGAAADGLALALRFNPVLALVGAVLCAGLLAVAPVSHARRAWGVGALVMAWLVGDGLRVLARARDAYDGVLGTAPGVDAASGSTTVAVVLGVWAVAGLFLGYVVPALAGIFVGRRVTHGTGWLAAAGIAVTTVVALSGLVSAVTG